ncbi:2-oxo acid dehydrogenase subunit E2 [Paracoccus aminophilus]|uniref:2-oxoacid dehydrogenases acyltransferase n=1 Tax=Paracoccus aminophilus JCM 7686 TaxID=1367847 RepID=S5YVF6_PARAH|nr:2-oxo acid dehydrogenase subunit E2 [Paracoccus aminophilus]AGT09201.1 2-oxoacid dehydrogenases acyltransferase [Paracoccus aminophilus JCM 7686]
MTARAAAFPAERAHTYAFLRDARNTAHVFLTADVDTTALQAARARANAEISYVSYVVKAAAEVLAKHSAARTTLRDGLRPRMVTMDGVTAKVLFDKDFNGTRCVASGTVEAPDKASVAVIQSQVDHYKAAPIAAEGPFAALWKLRRLPLPAVRLIYNLLLASPKRRARFQGTFSVTSVGHRDVRSILPMIATPIGLGMGRIAATPVVRDGKITIAPQFTLSLAFDHRVLDGALAADLLADIKHRLETWEN